MRRVCVAVDGSPLAAAALEWTLLHLVDPSRDMLHLVSVAQPPPRPVRPQPLLPTPMPQIDRLSGHVALALLPLLHVKRERYYVQCR